MKKKAQAWGFDLMIASFIFLFAIFSFFLFASNYSFSDEENFQVLQYEGEIISDSLLSEGSPIDWNNDNVERIGLLTDGKINQTKLDRFYYLAEEDLNRTKSLFNVKNNYFVNFSKQIVVDGNFIDGIGNSNFNSDNLVRIDRVSIYNNEPIILTIYITD